MDTRVLVVEPDKGAEFPTIGDALRAASDGDTVLLRAGCYEEKLILDKAVHIVVDPEAEPGDTVVTSGVIATAAGGSITNLVIQQLVDVRAGTVLLQNCEITMGGDGVRIAAGANPTIRQCKIHGCQGGGAGVYFQEEAAGTVEGCDISNMRCEGIHVKGAAAAVIRGNHIHDCPNGVYFRRGGRGTVEENTIARCSGFGIYVQSGSDPLVGKNTIEACGIHGILLSKGGSGNYRDNTVTGCGVRIYTGCTPTLGVNAIQGKFETDAVPQPVI